MSLNKRQIRDYLDYLNEIEQRSKPGASRVNLRMLATPVRFMLIDGHFHDLWRATSFNSTAKVIAYEIPLKLLNQVESFFAGGESDLDPNRPEVYNPTSEQILEYSIPNTPIGPAMSVIAELSDGSGEVLLQPSGYSSIVVGQVDMIEKFDEIYKKKEMDLTRFLNGIVIKFEGQKFKRSDVLKYFMYYHDAIHGDRPQGKNNTEISRNAILEKLSNIDAKFRDFIEFTFFSIVRNFIESADVKRCVKFFEDHS